jgi:DNA-binding protein Fis
VNHVWQLPESGVDLPELNRTFMVSALTRTHGNVSDAAKLLGLTRPVLRYRIKKYGLGR